MPRPELVATVFPSTSTYNDVPVLQVERRLLKAALLYADEAVEPFLALISLTVAEGSFGNNYVFGDSASDPQQPSFWRFFTPETVVLGQRLAGIDPTIDLGPAEAARVEQAFSELSPALRRGALLMPRTVDSFLELPRHGSRSIDVYGFRPRRAYIPQAAEGLLATSLLGEIEAFPDASMDVVLDVRDRLKPARAAFCGAILEAAKELAQAEPKTIDTYLADLRARVVEPALAEIREELDALNVRRTLLRITADRVTVAAVTASFSVAAGAVGGPQGLSAALHAALAGPLVAAAAKEAEFREDLRSQLRVRPYWFLHEASVRTHRTR